MINIITIHFKSVSTTNTVYEQEEVNVISSESISHITFLSLLKLHGCRKKTISNFR